MPQIVRHIGRTLRRGARRAVGVAFRGLERVEGAVSGMGDPEAIPLVLAPSLPPTAVPRYRGQLAGIGGVHHLVRRLPA